MIKLDLKKQLKHLYNPPKSKFTVIDVPAMNFLMIDGTGDPNVSGEFQDAMGALYGLSYTLKFASKKQLETDYVVMALEGLWWTDETGGFDIENKGDWQWTLMIMQPDHITAEMAEAARAELAEKKDVPALPRVRFERFAEGLSVQIMYLGAYADEGPTIARMHAFIEENGYEPNGKHHEIYLGDPRRTAPERLRTVLRQPIRKA